MCATGDGMMLNCLNGQEMNGSSESLKPRKVIITVISLEDNWFEVTVYLAATLYWGLVDLVSNPGSVFLAMKVPISELMLKEGRLPDNAWPKQQTIK